MATLLYDSVADDEGLRGNLTDPGYAPLLRWVAERAADLAQVHTEADLDRLAAALRGAVQRLVAAAETGNATQLESIDPALTPPALVQRMATALRAAPLDPDARAIAMAVELAG